LRTVCRIELAITPEAQKALHATDGKEISDLRADAENARPEAAESRVLTGIIRDLLIGITGDTDVKLFGQEMRCAPIEVEIDAAAILGVGILEIVGEAAVAENSFPVVGLR